MQLKMKIPSQLHPHKHRFDGSLTGTYHDLYTINRRCFGYGIAPRDPGGKCYAVGSLVRSDSRMHHRPQNGRRAERS